MKKLLKYTSLIIVLLFITGCGSDPKKNIKVAFKKLGKLDNYQIDVKINYVTSTLTYPVKVTSEIDLKNEIEHMIITKTLSNNIIKTENYINYANSTIYSKNFFEVVDNSWTKENSDRYSKLFSDNLLKNLLENATDIKRSKSETKEDIKYEIKIPYHKFQKSEGFFGINRMLDNTSNINLNSLLALSIYVTKKSGYISKIYIDFLNKESQTYNVSIAFSKFNVIKNIEIPSDALTDTINLDIDDHFDENY